MVKHWRSYIAEFIGTFFLVFFGCGAIILSEVGASGMNPVIVPIVFGGAISVMIYATGHISGAHFNPAVTIAFWVARKLSSQKVIGYIIAQITGGILASYIHLIIFGNNHSFGATYLSTGIGSGLLVEIILSFSLMFVIISVATDTRAVGELAGMAIGSTVAVCSYVGGPLTGCSMNPARSLAPALFYGDYQFLWIYLLAPILGTIFGAIVYEKIKGD